MTLKRQPVEQLDKDGKVINTFESVYEAAKSTGIDRNYIRYSFRRNYYFKQFECKFRKIEK